MRYILITLILYGCASNKYAPPPLEHKVVSYRDPVSKVFVYDYDYKNGVLAYKKLLKENRITSDVRWSCFKGKVSESVNYIEMLPSDVKYFRSLHMDEAKIISYEKQDINVDDKYIRKYKEKTTDAFKLISKKCIIDGTYVISEFYVN